MQHTTTTIDAATTCNSNLGKEGKREREMPPVLTKNPISDDDSNSSKRARSPICSHRAVSTAFATFNVNNCQLDEHEPRPKKKRSSRWSSEQTDKAFIPGMPTIIPSNMSKEQEKAYLSKKSSFIRPIHFLLN